MSARLHFPLLPSASIFHLPNKSDEYNQNTNQDLRDTAKVITICRLLTENS